MLKRTFHWQFTLEDGPHQVTLTTDLFRYQIQVDQANPVTCRKSFRKRNYLYTFDLGSHCADLSTQDESFFTHRASLSLDNDNDWIPGDHEIRPNQEVRPDIPYLHNYIFLKDLAHQLGFKLVVLTEGHLLERVLVGVFNGFLSSVRVERDSEDIPYYLIFIRCESMQDIKTPQKEISNSLRKIPFIRNRDIRYAPQVVDDLVILRCYFNTERNFINELRRYLDTITTILTKYSRPTDPNLCEMETCQNRLEGKPNLVLVNKFPLRGCPACLNLHQDQVAERVRIFKQSPSGLKQGIIASLLTMFASSLVVFVLMNMGTDIMWVSSLFVPMLAFFPLPSFFERANLKLTRQLFVISAASIAAINPIGTYLALIWRILQNPGLLKYSGILLHPWSYLGKEWGLMWFVAFWTLLFTIPLQHRIWTRYWKIIRFKYRPQVVVVNN